MLVSLALVAVSLAWLKSRLEIPGKQRTYIIRFDRVDGLKIGDPVEIRGLKLGRVANIKPSHKAVDVLVELVNSIELTQGTSARLVQAELFGAKRIELALGLSEAKLNAETAIPGQTVPDLAVAIEQVGGLLQAFPSDSLKQLLQNIQEAGRGASQILSRENARKLELLLQKSEGLIGQLELFTWQLRSRELPNRLATSLDLAQARLVQTERLIDSTQQAVSEIRHLVANAEQGLVKADTTLASINSLLNRLKKPGTVSNKILEDTVLGAQLDTTLIKLNQTLDYFRQQAIQVRVKLFKSKAGEKDAHQLRR